MHGRIKPSALRHDGRGTLETRHCGFVRSILLRELLHVAGHLGQPIAQSAVFQQPVQQLHVVGFRRIAAPAIQRGITFLAPVRRESFCVPLWTWRRESQRQVQLILWRSWSLVLHDLIDTEP